jgi:hypothetical protein
MSLFRCELLARHHDRQAFRCGVPELFLPMKTIETLIASN